MPVRSFPVIDPRTLRSALGAFTTGVTVITTRATGGAPIGLTANSFNSVSLDPPLVLWSLAKNSGSFPAFEQAEFWAVHILTAEQQPLSDRFARKGGDKFSGLAIAFGYGSIPLLEGCAARLQCRTSFRYEGGDHTIFVGEVVSIDHQDADPLVFQAGKYAVATQKAAPLSLAPAADDAHSMAYSEDFLGYLLWRAHHQFQRHVREHVRRSDLSMLEYYLLCALVVQDGRSLENVNAFTGLTGEEAGPAEVERLRSVGFLWPALEENPDAMHLTGVGREATLHIMAAGKAIESDVLGRVGYRETLALKNLLKQLIVQTGSGVPHPWDDLAAHGRRPATRA